MGEVGVDGVGEADIVIGESGDMVAPSVGESWTLKSKSNMDPAKGRDGGADDSTASREAELWMASEVEVVETEAEVEAEDGEGARSAGWWCIA